MKSSKAFIAFLGLVHSRKYTFLFMELVQHRTNDREVLQTVFWTFLSEMVVKNACPTFVRDLVQVRELVRGFESNSFFNFRIRRRYIVNMRH